MDKDTFSNNPFEERFSDGDSEPITAHTATSSTVTSFYDVLSDDVQSHNSIESNEIPSYGSAPYSNKLHRNNHCAHCHPKKH